MLKRIIDRIIAECTICLLSILQMLPLSMTRRIGRSLGRIARILKIRDEIIRRNLMIAFPEKTNEERNRIARDVYLKFGEFLGFWLSFKRLSKEYLKTEIEIKNLCVLEEALDRGRGVFLVTAHFGVWELIGNVLPKYFQNVNVVLNRLKNKRLNQHFEKLHAESGIQSIYKKKSAIQIVKRLAKNNIIAMFIDQNAGSRGVFVPFFNRLTLFHRGPAQIALRTDAAIVTSFIIPVQGKWQIVLSEIDTVSTGDVELDTKRIMSDYASQLEKYIRQYPSYYFWFHNRWKVAPPEEKSFDS